jgi:parvulin-like peptidyl-prolyl isomerase
VLAAGVIGYGYWDTSIRSKNEAVLQVGDTSLSLSYLERRIHQAAVQSGYQMPQDITASQTQQILESLLDQVLTQVESEELTRQGAPELGITATDQEIDDEIAKQQGVTSDASQEEFLTAYSTAVRESGLSTEDYRNMIEASVLDSKVRDKFLKEAPDTAEQVRFRLILVATEDDAKKVIDRLDAGEDFGDLARELSTDSGSKDEGGEYDWMPVKTLPDQIVQTLSNLKVGERSEPIAVSQGYLVLEPLDKPTERETTDDQKSSLADRAFSDWQDEVRSRVGVVDSLSQDQTNTLLQEWFDETQGAPSG